MSTVPKNRPQLGQAVCATKRTERKRRHPNATWIEMDVEHAIKGVYVGYRLKQNGHVSGDYEDGTTWIQEGVVVVALICVDERKQPVPVPFSSLEIQEKK